MPDFVKLSEVMVDKNLFQLAEKAYDVLGKKDWQAVSNLLTQMLHSLFECLDLPFAKTFKEKFKDFFEVENVSSLLHGYLKVERGPFSYSLNTIGDDVSAKFSGYENFKILFKKKKIHHFELSVRDEGGLLEEFSVTGAVEDETDIVEIISIKVLPEILVRIFSPLWFGALDSFLLTDSRAGVLRMSRMAMAQALQYAREKVPAKEAAFLSTHIELMERLRKKGIVKNLEEFYEKLLKELGIRNAIIQLVGGLPEVIIEDLWGKRLPLEKCPSGIRETFSLIAALATEGAGTEALFAEEIEAHLHPKALDRLISLIWEAVLIRQESPIFFIATTHNPVVLSKLNNLILKTARARERYENPHDLVTIVHLKEEDDGVVGEELEVSKNGFDESKLSEIFIELLEERAEYIDSEDNRA